MHALVSLFLVWGARCVSVGCCDVYSVVFYVHNKVYTAPWSHGISAAPPRVEVVSGLVREDIFVPSRRFREDGLEALKLSTGAGAPE